MTIADFLASRPGLARLRTRFTGAQHDIRFVGGFVRCMILGEEAADVDLCTDATPEEQIAIYKAHGYRFIETGLQHGTLTVVIPDEDTYEITSLRSESDHDGRHATVTYHRDWDADLARRDLTCNAIAMSFDGTIHDPFGGYHDLDERRIRFVGVAEERMKEDYLRILRWLRFHARLARGAPLDAEAAEAARRCAQGLSGISKERVWSEVRKILMGPSPVPMIQAMHDFGLAPHIGLPEGCDDRLHLACCLDLKPETRMAAYLALREADVLALGVDWRWSGHEISNAVFVCRHINLTTVQMEELLVFGPEYRSRAVEWAKTRALPTVATHLETWEIPIFPISGDDVIAAGVKPGPEIGAVLKQTKKDWFWCLDCTTDRGRVLVQMQTVIANRVAA